MISELREKIKGLNEVVDKYQKWSVPRKLDTQYVRWYSETKTMPRGYPSLTAEQRQTIMSRIKEKGEKVPDLAKEYGVKPQNIYSMLSSTTGGSSTLEISKLKRERDALLQIVGKLIVDQKLGKKIINRYGG